MLRAAYSTITAGASSPLPANATILMRGVKTRECCGDLGLQTRDRLKDAFRPRIAEVLERLALVLANIAHA
jgi:hypothetical protein